MKKIKTGYLVGIIVLAVLALLSLGRVTSRPTPPSQYSDPGTLPGIQTGMFPWQAEREQLLGRLRSIGLPALSQEGNALHIHQHLAIFIHGQSVSVPSSIGINEAAQFISPIHTHDETGIMHVESPTVQDFTLGQFFDIWGVRLTKECLGSYCTDATSTLKLFVNGSPFSGEPRSLVLTPHQEIVLTYGTRAELPATIPSSYSFEPGL